MASTQRSMLNMARGALAVAGVAGLGYMIKSTLAELDAIAKMSERLDIASEKLMGLHHAAKIMGTSGEALNKALMKMSKNLGEVAFKTSEVEYALDFMGLSAKEFDRLNTYDKFLKLSDAINLMPMAQQIALTTAIFGKSGTEMLNMIKSGSTGIEGLVAEAKKLGATVTNLDLDKVQQANDAIERMQTAFKGAFQTLVIALAPNITAIADKITEMGTDGKNMGDIMVNALSEMTGGFISMGSSVALITAQVYGFKASVLGTMADLIELKKIKYVPAVWMFNKFNAPRIKGWREAEADATLQAAEAYQKLKDMINKVGDAQLKLQQLFGKTPLEQLQLSLEWIDKELLNGSIALGEYGKQFNNLLQEYEKKHPLDLIDPGLLKEFTTTSEKLQKQLDTFGMTSNESMFYDLQKLREGLTGSNLEIVNSQLETIKGIMAEIEKKNVWQKQEDEYNSFLETLKSPLDKAMEQYKNIDRAFEEGLITLKEWKKLLEQVNEELGVNANKASESAFTSQLAQINKEVDMLNEAMENGLIDIDAYTTKFNELAGKYENLLNGRTESAFSAMPGEFQAVREQYVSVAGLSMGGFDPIAKKLDEQVHEQKKTTQAVEKLEGVA